MNNSKNGKLFISPILIFWGAIFTAVLVKMSSLFIGSTATNYVGNSLLEKTSTVAGIPNAVTAVVVYFRGLDTLGEVSVLFLVSTGVGLLLGRGEKVGRSQSSPSAIVAHAKTLVLPHFILTGLYITLHGHLTPGGGFQGGVMAAGVSLLLILAGDKIKNHKVLHALEGVVGSLYALVAISGIWLAGSFLGNYLLPTDIASSFGTLFSGGILPILYIFVGVKVGTELIGIYQNFQPGSEEH